MRRLILLVLLLFWAAPAPAQTPAVARAALQKGNYAEAEELYEELAKQPKFAVPAALGLSRALEAQGNYDGALAAIEAGLKSDAAHADLHGRRAELLFERGRWDDAKHATALALKKSPDHLLAHWVDAQIVRDSGDWSKAAEAFRWFVKHFNKRSDSGMEITAPDELLLVGLATLEYARYYHINDQFSAVLEDMFGEIRRRPSLYGKAQ
jgi:tetratricopeptide (TPR) repeat protein